MSKYRQYSDEESLYTQEYMDHVQAMTAEKLHGKAEIAVELAGRDREIAKLKQEIGVAKELIAELIEANENEAWRYPTIWEPKIARVKAFAQGGD